MRTIFDKKVGAGISLAHCLDVNQLAIHNLHSLITDIIHPDDPLHLVVCLELLCDAFRFIYQPKKHFLRLPVNISKISYFVPGWQIVSSKIAASGAGALLAMTQNR
jgi:hypothetical protein